MIKTASALKGGKHHRPVLSFNQKGLNKAHENVWGKTPPFGAANVDENVLNCTADCGPTPSNVTFLSDNSNKGDHYCLVGSEACFIRQQRPMPTLRLSFSARGL